MSTVKVKLKGSFTNKSASIDGSEVRLKGTGNEFTGESTEQAGDHELNWSVRGNPGEKYTVALSGDTADWSRSDFLIDSKGYGFGFHFFKVS
jgi:hypothetical protein